MDNVVYETDQICHAMPTKRGKQTSDQISLNILFSPTKIDVSK
jgi:hypothetical protein